MKWLREKNVLILVSLNFASPPQKKKKPPPPPPLGGGKGPKKKKKKKKGEEPDLLGVKATKHNQRKEGSLYWKLAIKIVCLQFKHSVFHSVVIYPQILALIIIKEFMHNINFSNFLKQTSTINENWLLLNHANHSISWTKSFSIIAISTILRWRFIKNPIFQNLLAKEQLFTNRLFFIGLVKSEKYFSIIRSQSIPDEYKAHTARNKLKIDFRSNSTHSEPCNQKHRV